MKKMLFPYKSLVFLFLASIGSIPLFGQKTSLVKNFEQKFEVNKSPHFELINKYGDVIINGYEGSEAIVNIKITSYGKDDDDAKKMMDRVEFDFNVTKDFVEIETILDRDKNFIAEFFNLIGDYSKSLLSKNELNIDFEVMLPSNSAATINNKFGSVVINDIYGKVTVDLAHGDLEAGNLQNMSRINVNYGDADIESFKTGRIDMKGGNLTINYAEKLILHSFSSDINLDQVGDLKIESTSDKLRIANINTISGKANFTSVDLYELERNCDLDQSFGELFIHHINEGFSTIRLNGKATDYILNFYKGNSFKVDLHLREDKLKMLEKPRDMVSTYEDDKQKNIHITGNYGENNSESLLYIQNSGDVTIDFIQKQ